jgi:leucyl-tRNA synthetase
MEETAELAAKMGLAAVVAILLFYMCSRCQVKRLCKKHATFSARETVTWCSKHCAVCSNNNLCKDTLMTKAAAAVARVK